MDVLARIKNRLHPVNRVVLLLFAVNFLLVFNQLLPTLRDLNLWDEAVYIYSGKQLIEGILPPFSRNPLVALLYALTYLPFLHSPFWMVQSAALGRMVNFSLMWSGGYLIAGQLKKHTQPLIYVGIAITVFVLTDILGNPSDALFAAMSGLALWQMLAFYHTREERHLWGTSLFIGLAALSRNDGLIQFAFFIVIVFILARNLKRNWRWLPSAVIPFVVLVGGYVLLYGAVTGDFNMYTKERSYTAFQQGQSVDYKKDPSCDLKYMKCAVSQAEELYGTAQENNYSIFRAISRNPQAYLSRLFKEFGALPDLFVTAYGKRTAFLVLLLTGAGMIELVRRKEYGLLALLLSWSLYLGVYFLTFFRKGYLQSPYFVVFALSAIGLNALAYDIKNRNRASVLVWSAILSVLSIGGIIAGIQALYFAALILLAVIWLARLLMSQFEEMQRAYVPAILLLGACLLIHGTFDPPIQHALGQIPEEQAILIIQEQLPLNSPVAAGAPGAVWAARMAYVDLGDPQFLAGSSQELHDRLVASGVKAIYVDPYLSNTNENVWRLIEPYIKKGYETAYSSSDGSIRVLLVQP
jgi:hypothetical protein